MIPSVPPDDVACRLLKLEQQLRAYEALHAGELAELWQNLNECKRALTSIISCNEPTGAEAVNTVSTELRNREE